MVGVRRHAEHRLDQHEQARVGGGDPLERVRAGSSGSTPSPRSSAAGASVSSNVGSASGDPLEHRAELEQRVVAGPGQRGVAGDARGRSA